MIRFENAFLAWIIMENKYDNAFHCGQNDNCSLDLFEKMIEIFQ